MVQLPLPFGISQFGLNRADHGLRDGDLGLEAGQGRQFVDGFIGRTKEKA